MPSASYMRAYRKKCKALGSKTLRVSVEPKVEPAEIEIPKAPKNPAKAIADWSHKNLKIPPGHPNAGKPLILPKYFIDFLSDFFKPGVREGGCFVARKNAKSACVAVLCLAYLADTGPLRRLGWRGGAASISRDKATELWQQISDIAQASGLDEVKCWKVPRRVASRWGVVDFLSADRSAGHASGFDLAICDELGLFPAKGGRELVSGLMSSTSARDGRLLAISVLGDSDLSREMVERVGDPATVVYVHQASKDCALDDEQAWRQANPTLGTVKSLGYMRDMARRAVANPSEAAAFRVYDLNVPGRPDKQMIVSVDDWLRCTVHTRPERAGPCALGFDAGGACSMTAAAIFWPECKRLEVYGAFGDTPSLLARGEVDGVNDLYQQMADRGELKTWPGRVTPVSDFLLWIAELLDRERVLSLIADRYRQAEVQDALQDAGLSWPCEWRAQGSGASGSADVREFQRAAISGQLRPGEGILIQSAISESVLRFDGNGNPALDKSRSRGRIDALSAAVLAVGAGARHRPQEFTFLHIGYDELAAGAI